jgi:hypothetical protein
MKASLWFLSLAGWFIAAGFHLQAASTNAALLTLELRDGSRVVGKSGTENFKFHSEILGELKLATEQLNSVEFLPKTDRVKLVTTNGDVLAAEMLTQEIRVETSFGNINVPATALRRMSVRGAVSGRTGSGLVARWSGEGDGNDAVGDNPAAPVGPLNYAAGKKGMAFSFGGDGAYLLVHPKENLDVGKGDGFTFETWISPATVSSDMLIFEFERELGTANGSDVGMELAIHRVTPGGRGVGCLYANLKDAEDAHHIFASPPNMLVPGVWQHVALTYDKTMGVGSIYLNGAMVAHASLGVFTPQTSFPNLLLGAKTTYNSAMNPGNLYVGRLDEFGIYSRALSAAEIQAIYAEENGGAESN